MHIHFIYVLICLSNYVCPSIYLSMHPSDPSIYFSLYGFHQSLHASIFGSLSFFCLFILLSIYQCCPFVHLYLDKHTRLRLSLFRLSECPVCRMVLVGTPRARRLADGAFSVIAHKISRIRIVYSNTDAQIDRDLRRGIMFANYYR